MKLSASLPLYSQLYTLKKIPPSTPLQEGGRGGEAKRRRKKKRSGTRGKSSAERLPGPGINQAPPSDRCSAGTELRRFLAISCREQRRGPSRSPGWRWPCPPGCAQRGGARAPPGRRRRGAGRGGAGWDRGWAGGEGAHLAPHPAERLARGQPRSAAPESAPHRGAPRPRSLPNRYPPRRRGGGRAGTGTLPTARRAHTQTANSAAAARRPPAAGISPRHHRPDAPEGDAAPGGGFPPLFLGGCPHPKPHTHLPNGAPRALEVLSSGGGSGVGAASGLGVAGTTDIPVYRQPRIHLIGAATERDLQHSPPQTDRQTYTAQRVCICRCS